MELNNSREDIFKALRDDTWKEIQTFYLPGTMNYIEHYYHMLYNEIRLAGKRLDDLRLSMEEGKDTLEQFKEALTVWKELHLRAVGLYEEQLWH